MTASEQNISMPRVLVMMATYNGERYVGEQIESILAQEHVRVHLFICDDRSTDATSEICKRYADEHDNVTFVVNNMNKGIEKNFLDMVYGANAARYDYFALSDQDDWWMPEKLEHAAKALAPCGDEPTLYYSDVENVDVNLQNGVREYAVYESCKDNLLTLLITNWAAGCTMLFNPAFCELLQRSPAERYPRMHDVWIHLVALSCGNVKADLAHSYIKRRITGNNAAGVSPLGKVGASRLKGMVGYLVSKSDHYAVYTAQELEKSYGDVIHPQWKGIVRTFASMDTSFKARVQIALHPLCRNPYPRETVFFKVRALLNKL